jgi:hypothetical protein
MLSAALYVAAVAVAAVAAPPAGEWVGWIDSLGHDNYSYPWWITEQIKACDCAPAASVTAAAECVERGKAVDWRASIAASRAASGAGELTFCLAKAWLIDHMPTFDKHYLPGSVTVNATSMLDDNIAFTLMADRAAPWSGTVSLEHKLTYTLPYASYHESRQNWRPLFFAKFFSVVADAATAEEALERLIDPNVFLNWTGHYWPSSPQQPRGGDGYQIEWSSSTSPPIVAPLDFVAYGYASCSGWATLVSCVRAVSFGGGVFLEEENEEQEECALLDDALAALTPLLHLRARRALLPPLRRYIARAVGIPARQAGTPCWNSAYLGVDFRGLAAENCECSFMYRSILRESCSQFDSPPLTSLTISPHVSPNIFDDITRRRPPSSHSSERVALLARRLRGARPRRGLLEQPQLGRGVFER